MISEFEILQSNSIAMYDKPPEMGLLPDSEIAGCACAGCAGNVFSTTDFKGNR